MRDFREFKVWAKSHQLVLDVYRATKAFPIDERFALSLQVRRAATSIPCNIAEGCGRSGDKELGRFMLVAMGSASELEYQLLLARDLGYLDNKSYDRLDGEVIEVKRMLSSFIVTLRRGRCDEERPRQATAPLTS